MSSTRAARGQQQRGRPSGLLKALRVVGLALGILAGVLAFSAYAQTRLPDEGEQDRWPFAPGRIELGAQTGGGWSIDENKREATEFALLPRIGYVFAQQEYFLPGSFELIGEPFYLTVFQHQTVHVGGLAALLKYNVRTGTRWTPTSSEGEASPLPPIGSPTGY